MKKRIVLLSLSAFVLVLTILACTINIGGPDYPSPAIPVSTEAIGELQQNIQTAVAGGIATGQITLVITEPELTSYLAYRFARQPDPILDYPQVYLRDGQIQIYGAARKGYFVATANITLTAGVDETGQLMIDLTSADFGPLPIPDGLKEAIAAILREAYTGSLGPAATGFRLVSITISDGTMTVVGKIK